MYDIIIIGAGPAGLTAALYAGRCRLKTKIFEETAVGGQVLLTERIDNFPGFPGGIGAADLVEKMTQQVQELGIEIDTCDIREIKKDSHFILKTSDERDFKVKTVIIAAGAKFRKLGIPGEDRLRGKGISYCAICDGPLFKNKNVIVVGGGNRAVEEALTIERFASKVILMHRRDKLRAVKVLEEKLLSQKKIEILWDTIPLEFAGRTKLESIKIKNVKSQKERTLPADGVFVSIGMTPNTNFLNGLIKLDNEGYVITDDDMVTSLEGIYACGDCRKKSLRQVVTACAEGATAAYSAFRFLESKT